MHRRTLLKHLIAGASLPLWLGACGRGGSADTPAAAAAPRLAPPPADPLAPIQVSRARWREILPPDRYRILFQDGTEPPGSSPLDAEKREGSFICAACFLPLFDSSHKYDSGTGWPSFFTHLPGVMGTKRDFKLVWPRTEYHCIRCGGHQGHVFDDGPPPTGQRWCNNGLALEFVPRGEPLPEARIPA